MKKINPAKMGKSKPALTKIAVIDSGIAVINLSYSSTVSILVPSAITNPFSM